MALCVSAIGALAVAYGAQQRRSVATAEALPGWLQPRRNVLARVDVAPWVTSDEPEAALTESVASAERDYSADAGRPADIVYRPIGIRVHIVQLFGGGRVALVRGVGSGWQAYAPLDRLVPEVPPGTKLTVAGGFGGAADFFRRLAPLESSPLQIVTGTHIITFETRVAPFDPENSDLVRIHVRVVSGALRGQTGWIAAAYTGLPLARAAAGSGITAKACSCRLIHFNGSPP